MDNKTFEHLLDRHGPDLDRWPNDLSAQARSSVDRSAHARNLLNEARDLESALDDLLPRVAAPRGLRTRVLANLPEREAWFEWLTVKAWRPAALALVPLVVGFGVGLNVAQGADATQTAEDDMLLALFDPDELARYELPGANTALQP
ncbi:MAG: hypothetical protein F4029_13360 [Gammaproteobacteria bacterium]|nr:hypothetical protein [Gammaproteobacteria bacterium]MXY54938.1 hypothetical protein [Gammaproteobacteria bacterium]MYF29216.1 hypothetical protein [Gammaproteobacteria bacterium]MYK47204.1 hypothetical protein [Gammaproteobacteria bacterium]